MLLQLPGVEKQSLNSLKRCFGSLFFPAKYHKILFEQFEKGDFVSFFLSLAKCCIIFQTHLHLAVLADMIKQKQLFMCNILYEVAEEFCNITSD